MLSFHSSWPEAVLFEMLSTVPRSVCCRLWIGVPSKFLQTNMSFYSSECNIFMTYWIIEKDLLRSFTEHTFWWSRKKEISDSCQLRRCLVRLFLILRWGEWDSPNASTPMLMMSERESVRPLCLTVKVISTLWCCWEAGPWPVAYFYWYRTYALAHVCTWLLCLYLWMSIARKDKLFFSFFLNKRKQQFDT